VADGLRAGPDKRSEAVEHESGRETEKPEHRPAKQSQKAGENKAPTAPATRNPRRV
jgi:hypothetical protein